MLDQVELTDGTSGFFLTPKKDPFDKEPFNLDELVEQRKVQGDMFDKIKAIIEKLDYKIDKARAGGAQTAAEIEASKPVEEVKDTVDAFTPPQTPDFIEPVSPPTSIDQSLGATEQPIDINSFERSAGKME